MNSPEPPPLTAAEKTADDQRSDGLGMDAPLNPSPEADAISGLQPICTTTEAERARAAADLIELQKIVGDRVRAAGQVEEELDRILLDDD